MWNMPVKITEENRIRAYYYTKNMITILKLELVSSFAYITLQTSKAQMLNAYFVPVFLIVIFGTIALHIGLINKN
jgi:hypothetical protein